MQISVLTDNRAGSFTMAEHGLSYLIEYDNQKILFDTGQSDMFLKNAGDMNVDLDNLTMIVLSHGHFDHGNGLEFLSGLPLVCHPGCFVKRYRKRDNTYIGLKNTKEELSASFDLITSAEPYKISEKIYFLGEIPRLTHFESKDTTFVLENGDPDFVMDDSAVAMIMTEGLFVVTGCGHAGVVNTLEHAKKVTGIKELYGIMGGFHLRDIDIQTMETIKYLQESEMIHILPSHCTDNPALGYFQETFKSIQVSTGDVFRF